MSGDDPRPESIEMRVLIAEDDPTSLLMLKTVVSGWGHAVTAVSDGLEAWYCLREPDSPPLAILDREMPGLSGTEICQRVLVLRPDDPPYLILLTAKGEKRDVVEGLNAGANDYIAKPFDLEELRARIAVGCRVVELQQALARRLLEIEEAHRREEELRLKLEAVGGWLGGKGATSPEGLTSISALAQEVADAIGAAGIQIHVLQGDRLLPLTETGPSPFIWPALLESVLNSTEMLQIPGYVLLPLSAAPGTSLGVLVVHGLGRGGLLNQELGLVKLLARETASGLELLRLRGDLEDLRRRQESEGRSRTAETAEKLGVCPSCMRCHGERQKTCTRDGAALQILPDVPFEVAGRYRFERRLGVGGMGMVFRAHDNQLDRRVALKVVRLRQSLMDAETNRRRFSVETRILAGLNHPGIITLHDSGELASGTMYIVPELLTGLDLERVLSLYGPGTPAQVASMILDAGAALDAAHALGLVHRDVKPANIFIVPEARGFRAKLIDFGLARSQAEVRMTHDSCVVGTPRYMAPEIFKGSEGTARSDLYSLAAVAYEALTDRPVVRGSQIGDVVLEVLSDNPAPPSEVLGESARPLDSIFYQGLAKEPDVRPASVLEWASEVAERLRTVVAMGSGWPEIRETSAALRVDNGGPGPRVSLLPGISPAIRESVLGPKPERTSHPPDPSGRRS